MSPPSWREKPTLYMSDHGFTMLSDRMAMFDGAVDANDAGERPPYGSGYVGLVMLMLVCRSVVSSAPGVPFMIVLNTRPYPARTMFLPSLLTSHAMPRRGETLFLSPRFWKFTKGRTAG